MCVCRCVVIVRHTPKSSTMLCKFTGIYSSFLIRKSHPLCESNALQVSRNPCPANNLSVLLTFMSQSLLVTLAFSTVFGCGLSPRCRCESLPVLRSSCTNHGSANVISACLDKVSHEPLWPHAFSDTWLAPQLTEGSTGCLKCSMIVSLRCCSRGY